MRSFIRASRSALALTVCAALGLLGTVLSRILKQDLMFLSGDWWFLILCVLVFPLSAGIILLLRGIDLAEKAEAPKEIKL